MIRVSIKQSNGHYTLLKIKGHAEYAEHGQDLVCAGVSSVIFGLANAIDELNGNCDIQINDNEILFANIQNDMTTQLVIETGIIQLKSIAEVHSQYIQIQTEEE